MRPQQRCAYCENAISEEEERQFSIHRDGFGIGPEVPLCRFCGGEMEPTLREIWAKIAQPSMERYAFNSAARNERARQLRDQRHLTRAQIIGPTTRAIELCD